MIQRARAGMKVKVIGRDLYSGLQGGERGEIVEVHVGSGMGTGFGPYVYLKLDDGRRTHTSRGNLDSLGRRNKKAKGQKARV